MCVCACVYLHCVVSIRGASAGIARSGGKSCNEAVVNELHCNQMTLALHAFTESMCGVPMLIPASRNPVCQCGGEEALTQSHEHITHSRWRLAAPHQRIAPFTWRQKERAQTGLLCSKHLGAGATKTGQHAGPLPAVQRVHVQGFVVVGALHPPKPSHRHQHTNTDTNSYTYPAGNQGRRRATRRPLPA